MKRRAFLGGLAAGAMSAILPRRLGLAGAKPRPPNLIVVLADDLGWRDAGFAGSVFLRTPHLDRLAARGATFTQAYAAAPNCAPTRACLLTGQYTPRHGVYTVVDDSHTPGLPHHRVMASPSRAELDTDAETIAEVLSRRGYATGMVGMWNLGRGRRGPCTPTGQGFGSFVQPRDLGFERDAYRNAEGEYLTDRMTDAAVEFVRRSRSGPFFLYLAPHAIHEPHDPKPELLAACSKRPGVSDRQAAYAATVEALDANVGRLWAEIESLGLADETYLFFTSDNGGTHRHTVPLRGGKGELYEGGIRVPAFAIGPEVRAGQTCREPVSSIDLFPTLAGLAGAPAPSVDGADLTSMLHRGERLAREALFWHFPSYVGRGTPSSAIRAGDWKLIEFFETGRVELYNLADDPGEANDLSAARPELARRMYARLRAWQTQTRAPRPTEPNPAYDPAARPARGRNRGTGRHEEVSP